MNSILCIDCGLTKGKLLLFDSNGRRLGNEEFTTPLNDTLIDTSALRQYFCAAMTRLLQNADTDPADILCASVSGHGNGLYAIGETDVLPVGYSSMIRESSQMLPPEGKTFPIILQSDWSGQPLPLLAWLKYTSPQTFAQIKTILFCKDLLRWFMSGVAVTEETDASAAGLLNWQTGSYDPDLLRIYNLEDASSKLPKILKSSQVAGYVTESFAGETGLPAGIPILGGLFDVNSCMLGSGATQEGQYALIAGTWGINAAASQLPVRSQNITQCCRFFGAAPYVCIDSAPTSCVNLEWYTQKVLNGLSYADADRLVSTQPMDEELLYLPYLYAPMDLPSAQGGFAGLRAYHDPAAMLRAVFEGIVFEHRYRLEKLQRSGIQADCAVLSGGAANSAVFGQMFADACGLNIRIPAQPQSGALGGAILGMVSAGIYPDIHTAVDAVVTYTHSFSPNPSVHAYYERKFSRFRHAQQRFRHDI